MSDTQKQSTENFPEHPPEEGQPRASQSHVQPSKVKKGASSSGAGKPVFIYLAIMFAAAFLLLLMAYFIQQRNNEVAMDGLRHSLTFSESMAELLDENQDLRAHLDDLQDQLNSVQSELDQVNALNAQAQEAAEQYKAYSAGIAALFYADRELDGGNYVKAAELLLKNTTLISSIDLHDQAVDSGSLNEPLLRPYLDEMAAILSDKGYLAILDDGTFAEIPAPDQDPV